MLVSRLLADLRREKKQKTRFYSGIQASELEQVPPARSPLVLHKRKRYDISNDKDGGTDALPCASMDAEQHVSNKLNTVVKRPVSCTCIADDCVDRFDEQVRTRVFEGKTLNAAETELSFDQARQLKTARMTDAVKFGLCTCRAQLVEQPISVEWIIRQKGTRCRQPVFCVQLATPSFARVTYRVTVRLYRDRAVYVESHRYRAWILLGGVAPSAIPDTYQRSGCCRTLSDGSFLCDLSKWMFYSDSDVHKTDSLDFPDQVEMYRFVFGIESKVDPVGRRTWHLTIRSKSNG